MNFDWNYIAAGAPYLTISRLGISLNTSVLSLLGNPEKILLGFDANTMTIGVKPYEGEQDVKTYDIGGRVKHGWVKIGCKDFISFLTQKTGMSFSPARRFTVNREQNTQILYVNLGKKEV